MKAPLVGTKPYKYKSKFETISDPYFWLRNKEDKNVIEYIKAENSFCESELSDTYKFQENLFQELKLRIKEDDNSVPQKDDDYYYYSRMIKGQDYPLFCRKKHSLDANEEVILDQNTLAKGEDFCDLAVVEVSKDHRLLAYSVDYSGDESYTIFIKDLQTGKLFDEKIDSSSTSLIWKNNCRGFYYSKLDENERPTYIYYHQLGDDPKNDTLIYHEKDPRFFIGVEISEDAKNIFISIHGNNMSEIFYADADSNDHDFKPIMKRHKDHEYDLTSFDDWFLIISNYNSVDNRLCLLKKGETDPEKMQDYIDYEPSTFIEDITVFEDFIVCSELHKGLPKIRVIRKSDKESYYIDFDDEAYDVSVSAPAEYKTSTLRYRYSSMKTPVSIFDFDMETKKKELKKKQEIPDPSFSEELYRIKRIYVKTRDETEVPVSILYHKDTDLFASNDLILYAYGSYGSSMDASFSSSRLSYVNRGFVYAIAHVRGGMELGRQWYLDGKLLKKKNTFFDYIDVAKGLCDLGITEPKKIAAKGGSAGGMLMGVVANWAPELFNSILAEVPFVDVLNTMLDDTLPLTTLEYNEWGNPNEKDYYDYIKSYSPYDNVSTQAYPHIMAVCGLNDMRVTYWEACKWIAKLRVKNTSDNLLLLKTHMDSGHSGSSGRYDYLKEIALEIAFICKAFNKIDKT